MIKIRKWLMRMLNLMYLRLKFKTWNLAKATELQRQEEERGLKEHQLETVCWLLDPEGPRGTGRTYLMAKAYIRIAKRHPNVNIHVIDHFPTQEAKVCLMDFIINELYAKEELSSFTTGRDFLRFRKEAPRDEKELLRLRI